MVYIKRSPLQGAQCHTYISEVIDCLHQLTVYQSCFISLMPQHGLRHMQLVLSMSLLPWPQCEPRPNETGGDEVCQLDRVQLPQVPGATPTLRETGEQISRNRYTYRIDVTYTYMYRYTHSSCTCTVTSLHMHTHTQTHTHVHAHTHTE